MTRRTILVGAASAGAASVLHPGAAQAQDASASALNYMQGFPPALEARVDAANWHAWPQVKWSVRHMRELFASRDAALPAVRPAPLRAAAQDLSGLRIRNDGCELDWQGFLAATHTDAAIVLVDGRVVFEQYFDGMRASDPHLLFSCTKSYCGFIAEILAARGELDFSRPVETYVPELSASAYAGVSVRHVADMTDGVRFREDYTDPSADIYRHAAAMGLAPPNPANPARGAYASLQTLTTRDFAPGEMFAYRSASSDVLGWVIHRAASKPLSQLYAEHIHGPLGAEGPAYFTLDAASQEIASLGLNVTLRDFARFGEALRRGGLVGQRHALPSAAVASVFAGGDRDAFARNSQPTRAGWSYRSQFWHTHDQHGSIWLLGVRGQRMLICPRLNLVMAKFGSHPIASNIATDAIHAAAIDALADRFG